MKAETLFLKELEKELKFLNPVDREDFMVNYRLQIYDRYKSGEEIVNIINSFENPEVIAKNIYAELEIDIDQQKMKKYKSYTGTKIFLGLCTILPQLIVFVFLLAFISIGFTLIPASLFCLTMFWINYEPLQAIGGSLLSLGLVPLLSVLFIYISKYVYAFQKTFFQISIELIAGREYKNVKKENKNVKLKNILTIVMLSIFSLFTIGGLIGCFAGDKTIGGASISKNMINQDITTLNYEENIELDYWELRINSWYKVEFVENKELHEKIQIKREHNFKKTITVNYTLTLSYEKTYRLNVDVPLNIEIFNISSQIFTVIYNPNEVKI
ncbi:HAAS signaling domain-containing protein [Spiroplasma culicicola]|uniref:DUF1700 domain-containing protein n=1 Tax=Spiroplasma culicicola AES-1 TaxID=1276246 RepID=W6AGE9_9MOLU|nr:DUF1700 domain-containing protein [Spiroplasma culicicola]AHI52744.1 hypothetical protein SCULI_v1c04030 [Spiroplasma culicicola AES-1]